MKYLHTPNLTWIGSWWPKIWPHEYLISPIEISVNNWPGSLLLEPGQFTLISMGLSRYSCGHISGPHEPIPTKFGLWMFFIMLHRDMVSKTLKCTPKKLWRHRFCTIEHPFKVLIMVPISGAVPGFLNRGGAKDFVSPSTHPECAARSPLLPGSRARLKALFNQNPLYQVLAFMVLNAIQCLW